MEAEEAENCNGRHVGYRPLPTFFTFASTTFLCIVDPFSKLKKNFNVYVLSFGLLVIITSLCLFQNEMSVSFKSFNHTICIVIANLLESNFRV